MNEKACSRLASALAALATALSVLTFVAAFAVAVPEAQASPRTAKPVKAAIAPKADYDSPGPVYRFANRRTGATFFTASEAERDSVRALPDFVDQGIAFYAYPGGGPARSRSFASSTKRSARTSTRCRRRSATSCSPRYRTSCWKAWSGMRFPARDPEPFRCVASTRRQRACTSTRSTRPRRRRRRHASASTSTKVWRSTPSRRGRHRRCGPFPNAGDLRRSEHRSDRGAEGAGLQRVARPRIRSTRDVASRLPAGRARQRRPRRGAARLRGDLAADVRRGGSASDADRLRAVADHRHQQRSTRPGHLGARLVDGHAEAQRVRQLSAVARGGDAAPRDGLLPQHVAQRQGGSGARAHAQRELRPRGPAPLLDRPHRAQCGRHAAPRRRREADPNLRSIRGGGLREGVHRLELRRLYGRFPSLAIDGPDDTRGGRWIPTTSTDEYGATLAKWFGVTGSDPASVFPNLARFAAPDLGFMA